MSYEYAINPLNIGLSMGNFAREFGLTNAPLFPPYAGNLPAAVTARTNMVSVDYASQIGFVVGSGSTTGKVKVFLVEVLRQSEAVAVVPGADVYSARYACGFRVGLRITENQTAANVNIGQIAAQATLGMLSVNIDVMLLGLNGAPAIPAGVLNFSEFNAEKLALLNKLIDDLSAFVSNPANAASLNPTLISVTPNSNLPAVVVRDARAINIALKRLSNKEPLDSVVKSLKGGLTEDLARKAYSVLYQNPSLVVPGADQAGEKRKPSSGEISRANDILDGEP